MSKSLLLRASLPLLVLISFTGCTTSPTDPGTTPPAAASDSVTVFIDAATGGTVNLTGIANGAVLTIPPGAMAASGEISAIATAGPSPETLQLRFEPDGLQFSQPVQITIPIPAATKGNDIDDLITLFKLVLTRPDMWNAGSEITGLTALAEVSRWTSDTIGAELDHLQQLIVLSWRSSYLVVDIPDRHLRPGDGLFVMSGDASNYKYRWLPGHVGMVSYAHPDSAIATVIESTIGGPHPQPDGVQKNDLLRFKRTSHHLYLGARRPPGALLNDGLRESAAINANSRLGAGYAFLGGHFGGYNCTGLLEESWDAVGRGVMGTRYEIIYPTEMYNATVPITEITIKAGEELRLPVYPVVIATDSVNPILASYFLAGNNTSATIQVNGLPDSATWSVDHNLLYHPQVMSWTPRATQSDTTVTVDFIMTGVATTRFGPPLPYTNVQSIEITVLGKFSEITIYPAGRGQSGYTLIHFFRMPTGAIPDPPANEHLIDLATGLYPDSAVFPGQVFDNFSEGWESGNPDSGYYGATIHVTRANPWNTTPTGSHTWSYTVGYSLPRYYGIR